MKKYIATMCALVALVAASFVGSSAPALGAASGGINWKAEVSHECTTLVTSARRTAEAVQNEWPVKADRRAARLKVRANHCEAALSHIPGS